MPNPSEKMRPPLALLAFTLFTCTACIIVVDDTGISTHGFSSGHDHNGSSSKRIVASGTSATEVRQSENFESVTVQGTVDLHLTIVPGLAATEISVTGDDNIIPRVLTEVEDGKLTVKLKNGSYSSMSSLIVNVRTGSVQAAKLAGSGKLHVYDLDAASFHLELSGSGSSAISGKAQDLSIGLSGSGSINAGDLTAQNASVSLSGSGGVEINAMDNLEISISGSGSVRHSGDAWAQTKISGSGSVKPID